jgi:hypothetical protein
MWICPKCATPLKQEQDVCPSCQVGVLGRLDVSTAEDTFSGQLREKGEDKSLTRKQGSRMAVRLPLLRSLFGKIFWTFFAVNFLSELLIVILDASFGKPNSQALHSIDKVLLIIFLLQSFGFAFFISVVFHTLDFVRRRVFGFGRLKPAKRMASSHSATDLPLDNDLTSGNIQSPGEVSKQRNKRTNENLQSSGGQP